MIEFELTQDYIELIKLLKLLNLCESGSEAKLIVDEGLVKFNNAVEFQRRKKLRKNDIVLFQDTEIRII
ncbi:MAG: RNA-binding S4 domain-containing protein [Flavobacteriales bacterium]|nr:RNA-binding S4 domain-containing protein [Flavobacteriales bacterium]